MATHKILIYNFDAWNDNVSGWKYSTMLSLSRTHTHMLEMCSSCVNDSIQTMLYCQHSSIIGFGRLFNYLRIFGSIWIACGNTFLSFVHIYLSAFHLKWYQTVPYRMCSTLKTIHINECCQNCLQCVALTVIEGVI